MKDRRRKFETKGVCSLKTLSHNPGWSIARQESSVRHKTHILRCFQSSMLPDSPNKQLKRAVITDRREREMDEMITLIVLRKFFGSSGSSNGYDPTSITYSVTPQDQTSATWMRRISYSQHAKFANTMLSFRKFRSLNATLERLHIPACFQCKQFQW